MNIAVLTLFPELIDSILNTSITKRAINEGLINLESINIRDMSANEYGKVDDAMFGGGTGMLMMCQPIYDSYTKVCNEMFKDKSPYTVYMSPKGKIFNQEKAIELSKKENLIFICGHYEGVDQRVIDEIVDEEISIGDYVLTGGEIPACVVIDSLSRHIPGVLKKSQAVEVESHIDNLLEHPQYTRPAVWNNKEVPSVLLSGHHENINKYNRIQSLYETLLKRPDLFEKIDISNEEIIDLIKLAKSNDK